MARKKKEDLVDKLLTKLEELAAKVEQLSNQVNRPQAELPEKQPKLKKPKYLGEGVSVMPTKGHLDSNRVGEDQFIRESGTCQILPKIDV